MKATVDACTSRSDPANRYSQERASSPRCGLRGPERTFGGIHDQTDRAHTCSSCICITAGGQNVWTTDRFLSWTRSTKGVRCWATGCCRSSRRSHRRNSNYCASSCSSSRSSCGSPSTVGRGSNRCSGCCCVTSRSCSSWSVFRTYHSEISQTPSRTCPDCRGGGCDGKAESSSGRGSSSRSCTSGYRTCSCCCGLGGCSYRKRSGSNFYHVCGQSGTCRYGWRRTVSCDSLCISCRWSSTAKSEIASLASRLTCRCGTNAASTRWSRTSNGTSGCRSRSWSASTRWQCTTLGTSVCRSGSHRLSGRCSNSRLCGCGHCRRTGETYNVDGTRRSRLANGSSGRITSSTAFTNSCRDYSCSTRGGT